MTEVSDWYGQGRFGGRPMVSVATVTYNHEAFIADAIEGVLMQQTGFPVEMVIGEDCSTDRTRNVILEYMDRYPGFIRLSGYEKNLGAGLNFQATIGRCRGHYVALLDGDDYWTSPHKLQRQVELLEKHPEFCMSFHAVSRRRGERIVKSVVRPTGRRRVYHLPDLCQWLNISTSSMVYRRSALRDFPAWFGSVSQGDWAMQVLLAEKGDIAYIPEVMGVHRLHGTNIWAGRGRTKSRVLLEQIRDVEQFKEHLGAERAGPFEVSQARRRYELIHTYLDEGETEKARGLFRNRRRGYDPKVELLEPFLAYVHLKAPQLYRRLRLDAVYLNRLLRRLWGRTAYPLWKRLTAR